tara:strand:+ start:3042 stop:3887 length:846 start_codon:yes stop_codon:yes gene_type:complete
MIQAIAYADPRNKIDPFEEEVEVKSDGSTDWYRPSWSWAHRSAEDWVEKMMSFNGWEFQPPDFICLNGLYKNGLQEVELYGLPAIFVSGYEKGDWEFDWEDRTNDKWEKSYDEVGLLTAMQKGFTHLFYRPKELVVWEDQRHKEAKEKFNDDYFDILFDNLHERHDEFLKWRKEYKEENPKPLYKAADICGNVSMPIMEALLHEEDLESLGEMEHFARRPLKKGRKMGILAAPHELHYAIRYLQRHERCDPIDISEISGELAGMDMKECKKKWEAATPYKI